MARTVQDANLVYPSEREALEAGKRYWRMIDIGVALGYRKFKRGPGGKWLVRILKDKDLSPRTPHHIETLDGVADYYGDADGVTILNFSQAQAKAREKAAQYKAQESGMPLRKGPYRVADAIEDWLQYLANEGKMADEARATCDSLILPDLGHIEAAKLTRAQIDKWHKTIARTPARLRTKKGEAPRYREFDPDDQEAARKRKARANRLLTYLKAALNRAYQDGHIPSDDAWRRVKNFKNVENARVDFLELDEAARLVNACDPVFRPLVQAALLTGARYGELCRLNVADYHHKSGTVQILMSKSGKARHIFLNDEGKAFFERQTAGRDGTEPMIIRADGGRWARSHQVRPMKQAFERARITKPARFHITRHTYASLAVMAGAPLFLVTKNLGHRDTRMVEKHYGHLADRYMAETIKKTAPTFGFEIDEKVVRAG